jgi:hypothetical protein
MIRKLTSIFVFAAFAASLAVAQQFQTPVYYSTGAPNPYALVSADFNKDGFADFAVSVNNPSKVLVALNQGNGTFKVHSAFAGPLTQALVVADLNEDGNPDLIDVAANPINLAGSLNVFLGAGDGTFTRGNVFKAGQGTNHPIVADFNHDGHLDVAVVNWLKGGIMVFMGDGHGNLGTPASYRGTSNPITIAAADVNGDGYSDLMVAGNNGTLAVLLNNGDGTFRDGATASIDKQPGNIAMGDLNRDGKLDVVLWSSWGGGNLDVLLGNGDGTFGASTVYPLAASGAQPLLADFNLDGNLDVILGTSVPYSGALVLLYGNGDGTLQKAIGIDTQGSPNDAIVLADFNNDGASDVAVALGAGKVGVFLNVQ